MDHPPPLQWPAVAAGCSRYPAAHPGAGASCSAFNAARAACADAALLVRAFFLGFGGAAAFDVDGARFVDVFPPLVLALALALTLTLALALALALALVALALLAAAVAAVLAVVPSPPLLRRWLPSPVLPSLHAPAFSAVVPQHFCACVRT